MPEVANDALPYRFRHLAVIGMDAGSRPCAGCTACTSAVRSARAGNGDGYASRYDAPAG